VGNRILAAAALVAFLAVNAGKPKHEPVVAPKSAETSELQPAEWERPRQSRSARFDRTWPALPDRGTQRSA
jgi:hypothetical protein